MDGERTGEISKKNVLRNNTNKNEIIRALAHSANTRLFSNPFSIFSKITKKGSAGPKNRAQKNLPLEDERFF